MNGLRRCALATALVVLAPATALHAEPWQVERIPGKPGHPDVVLAPRAAPTATLVVRFRTGAYDDGQRYGLTRLSQHAVIDANPALGDAWHRDLYAQAATLTLRTGVRQSLFILEAPAASFDALATRLLQALLKPKLGKAGFEKARRHTLDDEVASGGLDDMLSFVAGQLIITAVSAEGGDYRNPLYGDRASVAELSLRDVEKHVQRHFTPANATVVVAGSFSSPAVKKALASASGGTRRELERIPPLGLPKEFERYALREVHLHAQLVDLDGAEQVAAARVLEALVWDRMMWRLRRRGVTYTPMTTLVLREWLDFLAIVVPVSNSRERGIRVEPLLRGYLQEIREGKVTDEEFFRNRDHAVHTLEEVDHEPTPLALALMEGAGRHELHSREVAEAARGLSRERFVELVKPWLADDHAVNFLFGRSRAHYKREPR